MGLRFRKSFRLAPGVKLNIGRKSFSASFGRQRAWYTTGTVGRRITFGMPGTGLSWTSALAPSRLPTFVRLALVLSAILAVIIAGYCWRQLGF
jgi:hypothetical protein